MRSKLADRVRFVSFLAGVTILPCAAGAQPRFTLDFVGPGHTGAFPGSRASSTYTCRLHTANLDPGEPGARGWSLGVGSVGNCFIRLASTLGTAAADVSQGGLRVSGFERTEFATGPEGDGWVSSVVLNFEGQVTLAPASSPHNILWLEVESIVPDGERCDDCELQYRGGMVGSAQPVPLVVTHDINSFVPATRDKLLKFCGVPCFPSSRVTGFNEMKIGEEVVGSSRGEEPFIEICASSGGYGARTDSLMALTQDVPNEFSLHVDVLDVPPGGQAGVEAREFSGTGSNPNARTLRICVEAMPDGRHVLVSGFRAVDSTPMNTTQAKPVGVTLPVRIGIEGTGDSLRTVYFREESAVEHAVVDDAIPAWLRVGMVYGSETGAREQPRSGVAVFGSPFVSVQPSLQPPNLSRNVENFMTTVDQETILTIPGTGLEETEEVTVAGTQAKIINRRKNAVSVQVPPTRRPVRGSIVVRTPAGTSSLTNSFFSLGRSFIRCDCNGDGRFDISDLIAMLNHRFLGAPPCDCPEAEDCNNDDGKDVSDAIYGLNKLFIDRDLRVDPPFPRPGVDPSVPPCGLQEQVPIVERVSQGTIQEGDVFSISGRNFSTTPEQNVVLIGGAMAEVMRATATELTVRASMILSEGEAAVHVVRDFDLGILIPLCRPVFCSPTIISATAFERSPVLVELIPSNVRTFGRTRRQNGGLVLTLDRDVFSTGGPVDIEARILAPAISGVSPGVRVARFQSYFWTTDQPRPFRERVIALANELESQLAAGGPLRELLVVPHPDKGEIAVLPATTRGGRAGGLPQLLPPFELDGGIFLYPGEFGRCGPKDLHPVNDEREFGWCRFEELVDPCAGLPQFEWFIPVSHVISKSGSLAGLPHPNARSPAMKGVMYNWSAYCHVRQEKLWNRCELEDLVDLGHTEVPDFPIDAWVLKTWWRTTENELPFDSGTATTADDIPSSQQMPAGADLSKFYSYVYSGDGRRWYLTALHHTTKDQDEWFWFDAYVPEQIQTSHPFHRGIGGCGGTNVDAPASVLAGIWKDHYLCTNIADTEPLSTTGVGGVGPTATSNSALCGNWEFEPECSNDGGSSDEPCLSCHDRADAFAGGTISTDFLYSLTSPISDPNPCDSGTVTYADIQAIFNTNCSCHTGGGATGCMDLSPGVSYGNIVNVPSKEVPSMDRIEPNNLNQSYLWRKLQNTHTTAGTCANNASCFSSGCGSAMPQGSFPLASSKQDEIEAWILGGADP